MPPTPRRTRLSGPRTCLRPWRVRSSRMVSTVLRARKPVARRGLFISDLLGPCGGDALVAQTAPSGPKRNPQPDHRDQPKSDREVGEPAGQTLRLAGVDGIEQVGEAPPDRP